MAKVAVESASGVYMNFCKEKTTRVLHVDDDAGFLAVAKRCIEEQNQFQVDTAMSAKETLEKLKRSEYYAVVLDYKMLRKNSLELLRDLRKQGNDISARTMTIPKNADNGKSLSKSAKCWSAVLCESSPFKCFSCTSSQLFSALEWY